MDIEVRNHPLIISCNRKLFEKNVNEMEQKSQHKGRQ